MTKNTPVYRIFVEKKPEFAIEAGKLFADLKNSLQLSGLTSLRLFNRYDVQGIDNEEFAASCRNVFAEPPVDNIYDELPAKADDTVFAIEYLPGQFDQRADSCAQLIQLLTQKQRPLVRTAKVYLLTGDLSADEIAVLKNYLINPVEAREASLLPVETLMEEYAVPEDVAIIEGFIDFCEEGLITMIKELGLAMDLADLQCCQAYFKSENRNPSLTEIRMIDTYWSDHCRHTTFLTQLPNIEIAPEYIQDSFNKYLQCRKDLNREEKPVCLMDIATTAMRWLRDQGKLPDLDQSEEINACSVKIEVLVNGQKEDWLLMFKTKPIITRPRLSLLAARRPVWAAPSVILCPVVPMSIRRCG